jgi:hypothetical protein
MSRNRAFGFVTPRCELDGLRNRRALTTVLEPTILERLRSTLERGARQASATADPMSALRSSSPTRIPTEIRSRDPNPTA